MSLAYYITDKYSLPTSDDKIDFFHLNILVAIFAGNTFDSFDPESGCALMRKPNGENWFIPTITTSRKNELRLIEELDCPSIKPTSNRAFIQLLISRFPVIINGVASENGVLKGIWRAESLTLASAATNAMEIASSVLRGFNEVIITEHDNINMAIVENAVVQAGFGQRAYFYYHDEIEIPQLLFITDATIARLKDGSNFTDFLVRMPELDRFSFVPSLLTFEDSPSEFSVYPHLETGRERLTLLMAGNDRKWREKAKEEAREQEGAETETLH